MADVNNTPLSDDEREELELLRAEKAAREEEARIRAERAELEALRAEQEQVDAEILRERAEQEKNARHAADEDTEARRDAEREADEADAAMERAHADRERPETDSEPLTFGQRMVMTPQAHDEDDIPGMAPAQKIVIAVCLVLAAMAIGYIVLFNVGGLG